MSKMTEHFMKQLWEHGQSALVAKKMEITFENVDEKARLFDLVIDITDENDKAFVEVSRTRVGLNDTITILNLNQVFNVYLT